MTLSGALALRMRLAIARVASHIPRQACPPRGESLRNTSAADHPHATLAPHPGRKDPMRHIFVSSSAVLAMAGFRHALRQRLSGHRPTIPPVRLALDLGDAS